MPDLYDWQLFAALLDTALKEMEPPGAWTLAFYLGSQSFGHYDDPSVVTTCDLFIHDPDFVLALQTQDIRVWGAIRSFISTLRDLGIEVVFSHKRSLCVQLLTPFFKIENALKMLRTEREIAQLNENLTFEQLRKSLVLLKTHPIRNLSFEQVRRCTNYLPSSALRYAQDEAAKRKAKVEAETEKQQEKEIMGQQQMYEDFRNAQIALASSNPKTPAYGLKLLATATIQQLLHVQGERLFSTIQALNNVDSASPSQNEALSRLEQTMESDLLTLLYDATLMACFKRKTAASFYNTHIATMNETAMEACIAEIEKNTKPLLTDLLQASRAFLAKEETADSQHLQEECQKLRVICKQFLSFYTGMMKAERDNPEADLSLENSLALLLRNRYEQLLAELSIRAAQAKRDAFLRYVICAKLQISDYEKIVREFERNVNTQAYILCSIQIEEYDIRQKIAPSSLDNEWSKRKQDLQIKKLELDLKMMAACYPDLNESDDRIKLEAAFTSTQQKLKNMLAQSGKANTSVTVYTLTPAISAPKPMPRASSVDVPEEEGIVMRPRRTTSPHA